MQKRGMFRSKKGALELSINSIVIIIIAMTVLGLGLAFVKNFFGGAGDIQQQVLDASKQDILDAMRRGDKKLSFPGDRIDIEGGDEKVIVIGVKNVEPQDISFVVCLDEIVGDVETPILPDSNLATSAAKPAAFLWDKLTQKLDAGEPNVYPITIKTARTASGTKLYKIKVLRDDTTSTPVSNAKCGTSLTVPDAGIEYITNSFFIKFI
ncbi:hypothetical protein J4401_02010 [Candidatus Woesearchaeota archaeon]|nr:hypothetical protein [Candidatus Woesearchaeota archaeon]